MFSGIEETASERVAPSGPGGGGTHQGRDLKLHVLGEAEDHGLELPVEGRKHRPEPGGGAWRGLTNASGGIREGSSRETEDRGRDGGPRPIMGAPFVLG